MGSQPELRVADDVASAAVDLVRELAPRVMLVTGGSTPRRAYERMAMLPLPWDEVELFLSDERCVPADDDLSNGRMVREALASRVPARFHPMDGGSCDAEGYERVLRERLGSEAGFDLAWYGLGPDAHTASLFPGRPEVDVVDRWVVHVPEAGWEPRVPRLSLTVPVLSAAATGVFLVTGAEKAEALRRLLEGDDVPAARLAPDRLIVLADRAAAP